MTGRYVGLLGWMSLGALYGWYVNSVVWVWLGCMSGAVAWLALDNWRFQRVVNWLRTEDWSNEPKVAHAWGQLVERIRKLQKSLNGKAKDSQSRLDEFLAAIQASPNGVLLLDNQSRIEWANETAAEHLGIDPQRDLMQHVTNLIRDPAFSSYLNKGEFDSEVSIAGVRASASKPVSVAIRVHPYGKKRKLLLSRDVTAVQQAEAMRRDFVANVSHEIRTPLTVLSGFVETMQTLELADADRNHYLGLMAQQAGRMQSLVSDLLTLSKLEGSPSPNRQGVVLVSELIGKCLADAQGLSEVLAGGSHSITAEVRQDANLAGSPDELSSAVGNLLSNAVRYTPAGGRIDVGFELLADGAANLWVTDTGPGIAPEHVPRLTERFYRVDRSRSRETGGTGLGLAIVKHAIQRHGGQVTIRSELGIGSTFVLHFPADRVRRVSPRLH
ncbi:MAG: phosphate regulon sensor histidine kinase PhoR [Burkholderiales bacterium]|nr:phosphate regulon sensor histidine kinase PhoR [Burkholderiales bacterium]